MTEIQPLPEPSPEALPEKPRCGARKFFCRAVALLILLLLAAVAALLFYPDTVSRYLGYPTSQTAVDAAKIADLEKRLQSVEVRLNESAAQNQAAPAQEAAQAPAESTQDIAHMKNDMIALSSALGAVQEEVKQSGSNAAQNRQAVQGMLAEAVAFIQLRESVIAGRSYTAELASMRAAAASDNRFAEALSKLDASAAKGVPSPSALEDELIAAEPAAEQSIDKSNAHGWWERLLAELKGLITIRPLHGGGATDAFGVMESALQKGDVAAALDALKNLPPAAQESLAEWKASAEARLNADAALHDLAALFAAPQAAPQVIP